MTMRKTTEFTMSVTVTYDETHSTPETAIEDFYRMLGEAEQAGLMDRQIIDISYGSAAPGSVVTREAEDGDDEILGFISQTGATPASYQAKHMYDPPGDNPVMDLARRLDPPS